MREKALNFFRKGQTLLALVRSLYEAEKVVGVELRDGLNPANFAEIMQNGVGYLLEGKFAPAIEFLGHVLPLLDHAVIRNEILLFLLGYLREHSALLLVAI